MSDSVMQRPGGIDGLAAVWQRDRIRQLESLLQERESEIASLRRRVADTEVQVRALKQHLPPQG